MVAYTPKYQIPYPQNTDPVGAAVFQQMAERIEQTLTNAQMPKAEQNLQIVGPYAPTSGYQSRTATTTQVEVCNVTIPDPGWRYRLMVFGFWEARTQTAGSRPEIVVRSASATGPVVGVGWGADNTQYHAITVTPEAYANPAAAPSFTGSQVVRAYLQRGFGTGTVQATNFKTGLVVYVVRV